MRARYDFRDRLVKIEMTEDEFVDHVEWLEVSAPGDGATRAWRQELNRVVPQADAVEEADLEARGMDCYGSLS